MSLLRAFIAIEIPHEIQSAIEHQTAPLRAAIGPSVVRWVPAQNMHLTLKFLGDVSPANVGMLNQLLDVEASRHKGFDIQIGGLGAFPNPRRPRVIWIGLQAPAALEALQRGLEAATAKLGFPEEKRPFSPHLTLGRVRQRASGADQQKIHTALGRHPAGALGTAHIGAVHLFKSDLKQTGAVYTCLHSAPFRNQSSP